MRFMLNPPKSASGYTLIEVMIVVAILGILSSLAIPQYLQARARAEAGATIGELVGIAKECAAANASKLSDTIRQPSDGATVTCNGSAANVISGRTFPRNATGISCLTSTITNSNSIRAVITAAANGSMSCAFTTT